MLEANGIRQHYRIVHHICQSSDIFKIVHLSVFEVETALVHDSF